MGNRIRVKGNIHETENYSWGVVQDMIEKEISSAFKLKEPTITMPTKKEIKQIIKKTVMKNREGQHE